MSMMLTTSLPCLSFRSFVSLWVNHASDRPSNRLSVCLSVRPSVRLCVCLSVGVCLPIRPSPSLTPSFPQDFVLPSVLLSVCLLVCSNTLSHTVASKVLSWGSLSCIFYHKYRLVFIIKAKQRDSSVDSKNQTRHRHWKSALSCLGCERNLPHSAVNSSELSPQSSALLHTCESSTHFPFEHENSRPLQTWLTHWVPSFNFNPGGQEQIRFPAWTSHRWEQPPPFKQGLIVPTKQDRTQQDWVYMETIMSIRERTCPVEKKPLKTKQTLTCLTM